ncbi:DCL family protein [Streptomyces sp. BA2]|uniref:DCL family protein n=1 Tax=Streptomyces sp. BA2 TaxID=436595 RepID=UPI00132BFF68|nr:DUF3223 domain-containing protein [Streptomyces sp. BA2]
MAIPVDINGEHFPTKAAATQRCQDVLRSYPGQTGSGPGQPEAVTDEAHVAFLTALIARHPDVDEKADGGIAGFKVQVNPEGTGNTRCFYVLRTDGSEADFSFRSCL